MAEKRVTRKQAADEVMKYAGKVSGDDVASTVGQEGTFRKLFSCVEKLSEYKDDVVLVFSMLYIGDGKIIHRDGDGYLACVDKDTFLGRLNGFNPSITVFRCL